MIQLEKYKQQISLLELEIEKENKLFTSQKINNINDNKVKLKDQKEHLNNLFLLKDGIDKKIINNREEINKLISQNTDINFNIDNIKKQLLKINNSIIDKKNQILLLNQDISMLELSIKNNINNFDEISKNLINESNDNKSYLNISIKEKKIEINNNNLEIEKLNRELVDLNNQMEQKKYSKKNINTSLNQKKTNFEKQQSIKKKNTELIQNIEKLDINYKLFINDISVKIRSLDNTFNSQSADINNNLNNKIDDYNLLETKKKEILIQINILKSQNLLYDNKINTITELEEVQDKLKEQIVKIKDQLDILNKKYISDKFIFYDLKKKTKKTYLSDLESLKKTLNQNNMLPRTEIKKNKIIQSTNIKQHNYIKKIKIQNEISALNNINIELNDDIKTFNRIEDNNKNQTLETLNDKENSMNQSILELKTKIDLLEKNKNNITLQTKVLENKISSFNNLILVDTNKINNNLNEIKIIEANNIEFLNNKQKLNNQIESDSERIKNNNLLNHKTSSFKNNNLILLKAKLEKLKNEFNKLNKYLNE